MAVFWVSPRSLVEVTNVSEVSAVSIIRRMSTHCADNGGSKHIRTPLNFCQITELNNPVDSLLHTRRRANLRSRKDQMANAV